MAIPPSWTEMAVNEKLDYLKYQIEHLWKVINPLAVGHQNLSSHHERVAQTLQEVATGLEKVTEQVAAAAGRTSR